MTENAKPSRRWRRAILALGAGLATAIVICIALLTIEGVQQRLLEYVLGQSLGMTVGIEGVDLGNPILVGQMALRDVPAYPDEPPFATLDGLRIGHSWNPFEARPLDSVRLERLEIDLLVGRFSNYGGLRNRVPSPPGSERLNALPREFTLDELVFRMARRPWQLSFDGLKAGASLDSLDAFSGSVSGDQVHLHWRTAGGEEEHFLGQLAAHVSRSGGKFTVDGAANVPEVMRLLFDGEFTEAGDQGFRFHLKDAEFLRTFWPHLLSAYVGTRFEFARLAVPVAALEGVVSPEFRLDQGRLELTAEGLRVGVGDEQSAAATGGLRVEAGRTGQSLTFSMNSALPELLVLDASGEVSDGDAGRQFTMSIRQGEMHSRALAERLLRHAPISLSVDHITGASMELSGTLRAGTLELKADNLGTAARGLVVGPRDEPYYSGDIALSGSANFGEQRKFVGELRLSKGDALKLSAADAAGQITLDAEIPDWNRDALLANIPERYAAILSSLPGLEGLRGPIHLNLQHPSYTLEASLTPRLTEIPEPATLSISGGGELGESSAALFSGPVVLSAGKAETNAAVQFTSADNFDVDARLKDMPLAAWARAVLVDGLPEGLDARLSGGARLHRDEAGYALHLELDAADARYGAFALAPGDTLQLRGDAGLDSALTRAQGKALTAAVGDKFLLSNAQWNCTLRPFTAQSTVSGRADLGFVGEITGIPDLFGEAAWEGALQIQEGPVFQLALHGQSDSLGYGDWTLPYRTTLMLDGPVELSLAKRELLGTQMTARLGEGNVLTVERISVAIPEEASGPVIEGTALKIDTDLAPVVAMSLLGDVEGAKAQLTLPSLRWTGEMLDAPITVSLNAGLLSLPDQVARLEAVKLAGEFLYKNAFSGTGSLEAAKLTAGGVSLAAINTAVRGDGPDLVLDQIQSNIFGGAVSGSVRLGLARETPAAEVALEVSNIDLERFTQEFRPPGVIMTGLASGTATVVFTRAGIQDFRAKLASSENFSLNRDMVEQVLLSQYIGEVSGGKQIEGVVQDVIGKDAQRAFDGAELDLGFEQGEIVGVVLLKSRKLNLTIDVTADPRSLVDAMQLRQEQAAGSPPAESKE